jgi:hypothetical protein
MEGDVMILEMCGNNDLHTENLPEHNCSNCKYFNKTQKVVSINGDGYAIECCNFVHPLEDCVLRGFSGHSTQVSNLLTI